MKIIADLHIHSKFSRATSQDMIPELLEKTAFFKKINIIGTGDCTHRGWIKELQEKLQPAEKTGLFRVKPKYSLIADKWSSQKGPYFMLTGEISSIYKDSYKTRKIHSLLLVPNFIIAKKVINKLSKIGNIDYDGRPIIGISAYDLAKIFWDEDEFCEVIPAHIWTPWFSIFGSKSGYDDLKDCYKEKSYKIHALETGLSSDPRMNWMISKLDKYTLISNSDAHSLNNIGREATVFDLDTIEYKNIINSIRTKKGFVGTIEFFPEEGKYHNDGHSSCKVNQSPLESKKLKNICPACGKPLTLGVFHRINALSNQKENKSCAKNHKVWYIIPLIELLSELYKVKKPSKKVILVYQSLVERMSEFDILIFASKQKLNNIISPELTEMILRMRDQKVFRIPGYDGVYGKIYINKKSDLGQNKLF